MITWKRLRTNLIKSLTWRIHDPDHVRLSAIRLLQVLLYDYDSAVTWNLDLYFAVLLDLEVSDRAAKFFIV